MGNEQQALNEILKLLHAGTLNIKTDEGFTNQFHFNDTCLLITILFICAFVYKKELMKYLA